MITQSTKIEKIQNLNLFLTELDNIDKIGFDLEEAKKPILDKFYEIFIKENDQESLLFLRLENEITNIGKSFSEGLTPKSKFIKKSEDGNLDEEIIWPDFEKYSDKEIQYFLSRYNTCSNLALRIEYGQLLFCLKNLKHSHEREILFNELWEYCVEIFKTIVVNKKSNNLYFFSSIVSNAFLLAQNSKQIKNQKKVTEFIESNFLKSTIDSIQFYTLFSLLKDIFITFQKEIKDFIQPEKIIKHIEEIALKLSDTEKSKSLLISAIPFLKNYKISTSFSWENYIAKCMEELADNQSENFLASSTMYFEASEYFKLSKNESSYNRVLKKYNEAIGKIKLANISTKLPEKANLRYNELINQTINNAPFDEILMHWAGYPHIVTKSKISAQNSKKETRLMDLFSVSSMDKFGNVVEYYKTDKERNEHKFWESYSINYQLYIKTIMPILSGTIKNKHLNYESLISFFEQTWLNEPISFFSQGEMNEIRPLDTIKPGLKLFFTNFNLLIKKSSSDEIDFVCAADSLALKIEKTIRHLRQRLEIQTKIQKRSNNGYNIFQEKTLGYLMSNLKDVLSEDDFILIDYLVLRPEKFNLRNDIAHGLLQKNEYNPMICVQLISIIIRLSNYQIIKKDANSH